MYGEQLGGVWIVRGRVYRNLRRKEGGSQTPPCTLHGTGISEATHQAGKVHIVLVVRVTSYDRSYQLFCRESLLWKNLIHDNILPFFGVSDDVFPDSLCMVIPWMENGSLINHLDRLLSRDQLVGDEYATAVNKWVSIDQIQHVLI